MDSSQVHHCSSDKASLNVETSSPWMALNFGTAGRDIGARDGRVGTIICPLLFLMLVPLFGTMLTPRILGRVQCARQNLLHW